MTGKNLDKAGIVIYGKNAQGKRTLVVPYSEGRFGYDHKYYALPIGTIDRHEAPRHAAARETEEETGISIQKLMGDEAYQAFLEGREVTLPIESKDYPGVRVIGVDREPEYFTYVSRANTHKHCVLYGVEVEGIEHLAGSLKNPENSELKKAGAGVGEPHKVRCSVKDIVSDKGRYPQFDEFMMWLRTGEMPSRLLKEGQSKPEALYEQPVHLEPSLFMQLESRFLRKRPHSRGRDKNLISTPEEWQQFCDSLSPQQDAQIGKYFTRIKQAVRSLGIVGDDHMCLKLDDKDAPLQFFQEGGEIITAEDYLAQCKARLADNASYNRAFGSAATRFAKKEHHVHGAQLAGMGRFVDVDDISKAFGGMNIFGSGAQSVAPNASGSRYASQGYVPPIPAGGPERFGPSASRPWSSISTAGRAFERRW